MTRGRRPLGVKIVEHLHGSEAAKHRLQIVLETVAGQRTVADACALLGLQEARFHELRAEVLQGALQRLEPRTPGRPRPEATPQDARVAALEAELRDLRIDLKAAQIREEIALVMPHLLQPPQPPSKKTPPPTPTPDPTTPTP